MTILMIYHFRVDIVSILMPRGNIRSYKPKPTYGVTMKASKTARHEYKGMVASYYGTMKVHRLVCEAFHGAAPDGKSVVIHLDEDSLNNKAENLRWGTQKENLNMPKFVEYCKKRTGENNPFIKGRKKTEATP